MRNRFYAQALLLILLLIGAAIVPGIVTGTAPLVRLKSAAPLVGEVSQVLGVDSNNKLPMAGTGFNFKSIQNFDDNQWVVASITTPTISDSAYIVFQKKPGYYAVVLGPGTQFDHDLLKTAPADVVQYLEQKGAVSESN